jgi:hypothetical protein
MIGQSLARPEFEKLRAKYGSVIDDWSASDHFTTLSRNSVNALFLSKVMITDAGSRAQGWLILPQGLESRIGDS